MTLEEMGAMLERLCGNATKRTLWGGGDAAAFRPIEVLSQAILALTALRRNAVSDQLRADLGGGVEEE